MSRWYDEDKEGLRDRAGERGAGNKKNGRAMGELSVAMLERKVASKNRPDGMAGGFFGKESQENEQTPSSTATRQEAIEALRRDGDEPRNALAARISNGGIPASARAPAVEESGILPLKIRLPKAGRVYHFNRLMTTQDALTVQATFVHVPMPWMPFAALGLLLGPLGGVAFVRFRRS